MRHSCRARRAEVLIDDRDRHGNHQEQQEQRRERPVVYHLVAWPAIPFLSTIDLHSLDGERVHRRLVIRLVNPHSLRPNSERAVCALGARLDGLAAITDP
jgi:hypothetical protein